MLCHVAKSFFQIMRGIDICGRIDDDVFAVLLPGVELDLAEVAVRRWLDHMVESPFMFEGEDHIVTFSAGVAELGHHEPDGLQLLAKAQMALEKIKEKQELNICVVENENPSDGVWE